MSEIKTMSDALTDWLGSGLAKFVALRRSFGKICDRSDLQGSQEADQGIPIGNRHGSERLFCRCRFTAMPED
jgi:hypothetical protein